MPNQEQALIPTERIAEAILVIRGEKVLLDADLAALYGVETPRLNERYVATGNAFRTTSCSS